MFLPSKIIKLNSLFIQQSPKMKKAVYPVIIILLCIVTLASCEKEYHCGCTFNNTVVYTKDLGYQYKNNAENECSSYDTTVTGEKWNCLIY
jgi:hypothetical protein